MIQGPGEWHDAPKAHASVGWFDPDNAAVRGGLADRASGIGADRAIAEPRGQGRCGSAGRPASAVVRSPRISNRTKRADDRAATIRELMHVVLAQEHSPSHLEAADDFRILGRHAILEEITSSGGANARGVHQVFERNRDSMERAFPASAID